jgi:hypothetical protein
LYCLWIPQNLQIVEKNGNMQQIWADLPDSLDPGIGNCQCLHCPKS